MENRSCRIIDNCRMVNLHDENEVNARLLWDDESLYEKYWRESMNCNCEMVY